MHLLQHTEQELEVLDTCRGPSKKCALVGLSYCWERGKAARKGQGSSDCVSHFLLLAGLSAEYITGLLEQSFGQLARQLDHDLDLHFSASDK